MSTNMIYISRRWAEPELVEVEDPAYFFENEGYDCLYHAVDHTGWNPAVLSSYGYDIDGGHIVILSPVGGQSDFGYELTARLEWYPNEFNFYGPVLIAGVIGSGATYSSQPTYCDLPDNFIDDFFDECSAKDRVELMDTILSLGD